MKKFPCFSQQEAFTQVLAQLAIFDCFFDAEAKAKQNKHQPSWDCIRGINQLCEVLGCHRTTARRLMRAGLIPGYKVNGTYYFLVFEILLAINTNPQVFRINWESYADAESSPDEMKIHWKKFLFPDRVLVKFTFLRRTSTLNLPLEMWGRNSKIIKKMLREINKRNTVVPFNATKR